MYILPSDHYVSPTRTDGEEETGVSEPEYLVSISLEVGIGSTIL
jgi:hypothetical protein